MLEEYELTTVLFDNTINNATEWREICDAIKRHKLDMKRPSAYPFHVVVSAISTEV